MKQAKHRLGIHEQHVVKRHLKLEEPWPVPESDLLAVLAEAPGVASAELNREKRRLSVAYDASIQNLDGVVKVLRKQGVVTADGWWRRFRADRYRNMDANIQDNAHRDPWSCHKDIPG